MARGLRSSSSIGKEQAKNIAGIVFIKQINRLGNNKKKPSRGVGTFSSRLLQKQGLAGSGAGDEYLRAHPLCAPHHLLFLCWGGPSCGPGAGTPTAPDGAPSPPGHAVKGGEPAGQRQKNPKTSLKPPGSAAVRGRRGRTLRGGHGERSPAAVGPCPRVLSSPGAGEKPR